jgi:hypothetical protein
MPKPGGATIPGRGFLAGGDGTSLSLDKFCCENTSSSLVNPFCISGFGSVTNYCLLVLI